MEAKNAKFESVLMALKEGARAKRPGGNIDFVFLSPRESLEEAAKNSQELDKFLKENPNVPALLCAKLKPKEGVKDGGISVNIALFAADLLAEDWEVMGPEKPQQQEPMPSFSDKATGEMKIETITPEEL
jgi:hypothetical protein